MLAVADSPTLSSSVFIDFVDGGPTLPGPEVWGESLRLIPSMEPLSTEGGIFESRFVDRVFSTPLVTMAAVEVSMNSSCFTDCGSCPVSIAIASVEEVVDNTDGGFDWSIPRELRLVTLGGLKSASDGFTSTCCCC